MAEQFRPRGWAGESNAHTQSSPKSIGESRDQAFEFGRWLVGRADYCRFGSTQLVHQGCQNSLSRLVPTKMLGVFEDQQLECRIFADWIKSVGDFEVSSNLLDEV